jgi:hypothetical protein
MATRGKFRSEPASGLRRRVVNLKKELEGLTENARGGMRDDADATPDSKWRLSHGGV